MWSPAFPLHLCKLTISLQIIYEHLSMSTTKPTPLSCVSYLSACAFILFFPTPSSSSTLSCQALSTPEGTGTHCLPSSYSLSSQLRIKPTSIEQNPICLGNKTKRWRGFQKSNSCVPQATERTSASPTWNVFTFDKPSRSPTAEQMPLGPHVPSPVRTH